jgi:hypothetical protein
LKKKKQPWQKNKDKDTHLNAFLFIQLVSFHVSFIRDKGLCSLPELKHSNLKKILSYAGQLS